MTGFQEFLRAMGTGRLIGVLVGGAVALALVYLLMTQMTGKPMAMLFGDLDTTTSAEIVQHLELEGVAYETKNGGATIYVDESAVHHLRMKFASDGLKTGTITGYEIFDNRDALGSTSFVQNINRVRALQGELARTISVIDAVESAKVLLVLPTRDLFSKDTQDPSASVTIKTRSGDISKGKVQAIQHLVASAVQGLTPNNVSIVDENGTLLASGKTGNGGILGGSTSEERSLALEQRLRDKVYTIVSSIVGAGNAHVQVSAEVDYNKVTEQSVLYDAEKQAVATSNVTEKTTRSSKVKPGKAKSVSVSNNLPGAGEAETTEDTKDRQSDQETETSENITYLTPQVNRTEINEAGGIKRLSVAVVVDGSYTTDADGNETYVPRTQEELQTIENLVKAAVSYSEERNDTIAVANAQFAKVEMPEPIGEAGGMFDFTSAQILEAIQTLIIGIVILVLTLLVIRPLLMTAMAPSANASSGAPVALESEGGQAQLAPPAENDAGGEAAALPPPDAGISAKIDIKQVEGQVQESSVRKVGELVTNHPDETLSILRTWLHNEA